MDKYEYKLRAEEIKTLISRKRFQEAVQVADTVDWQRVRNVSMLCTVSDLYKINRRFEEAKELLLLANEKRPEGRAILYSLCDLAIKMNDVVGAVEYYKEFVHIAPNDTGKYILLYKIYEAQDTGLEERIAVLEELKKRDYREKWAYELAYLYHRIGLVTKCVEECDQLILWFGDGKYVIKAMELKMLHQPLSPLQQQKYDNRLKKLAANANQKADIKKQEESRSSQDAEPVRELPKQDKNPKGAYDDIQIKPVDMGEYNTINLQQELAESMKELLEPAKEQTKLPRDNQEDANRQREKQEEEAEEFKTRVIADSADWDIQETGQFDGEDIDRELKDSSEEEKADETDLKASESAEDMPEEELSVSKEKKVVKEFPSDRIQPDAKEIFPKEKEAAIRARIMQEAAAEQKKMSLKEAAARSENQAENIAEAEVKPDKTESEAKENIPEDRNAAEDVRLSAEEEKSAQKAFEELNLDVTRSLFSEYDEETRNGILEQLQKAAEAAQEIERLKAQAKKQAEAKHEVFRQGPPVREKEEEKQEETESSFAEDEEIMDESCDSQVEELEEIKEEPEKDSMEEDTYFSDADLSEETIDEDDYEQTGSLPVVETDREDPEETSRRLREEAREEIERRIEKAKVPVAKQKQKTDAPEDMPEETPVQSAEKKAKKAVRTEEPVRDKKEDSQQKKVSETGNAPKGARAMSRDEKELFAEYIPTKGAMKMLLKALDSLSLKANTGNLIITGSPGCDTMTFAKNIIKLLKKRDKEFSGQVAKISGDTFNRKDAAKTIAKVEGGTLIIEKAGGLSKEGLQNLLAALSQDITGVMVILEDTKRGISRLTEAVPEMNQFFNARFDIEALDNSTLAAYGCKYAQAQEFTVDELGRLALHTRIEDMQTSDHVVTISDVKEIVDEAIESAERKSVRHFMDILLGKRYDEDDMIILRERDFI